MCHFSFDGCFHPFHAVSSSATAPNHCCGTSSVLSLSKIVTVPCCSSQIISDLELFRVERCFALHRLNRIWSVERLLKRNYHRGLVQSISFSILSGREAASLPRRNHTLQPRLSMTYERYVCSSRLIESMTNATPRSHPMPLPTTAAAHAPCSPSPKSSPNPAVRPKSSFSCVEL